MNIEKKYIEEALQEIPFIEYTEVQEKVIPLFMNRTSMMVEAKTGSGKTHAYLIPILTLLDEDKAEVQSVICAPTRELARQIFTFAKQMTTHSLKPIDVRMYIGGSDRDSEINRLEKGQPQIVIGTPGRLFDLIRKENLLKAHTASSFIIDEADMALENQFMEEIDGIASSFNEQIQIVVLSATIPEGLQHFLKKYLHSPKFIQIHKEDVSNLNIKHYFLKTKERDRFDILTSVLTAINPYIGIIFCNTKDSANTVYEFLKNKKLNVTLMHGDIDVRKRKQLLKRIESLEFQYLVATDLMSRGIDIDGVSHIINFELPKDSSFYVHRTGRTGRMAYDGVAISLYDFKDETYLDSLEAMGLVCSYIEIKNKEIVPAKMRNERSKRVKIETKELTQIKIENPKPKKVKPGYKKKYQREMQTLVKKAKRRAR